MPCAMLCQREHQRVDVLISVDMGRRRCAESL
jgi:hypothetical protein|eukprot:COSAG01_NODE_5690_length_4098_cov_2.867717_4_plen_32_part_00